MGRGTFITERNYTGKMARKWGGSGWDWTEMYGSLDALADIVSFSSLNSGKKKKNHTHFCLYVQKSMDTATHTHTHNNPLILQPSL